MHTEHSEEITNENEKKTLFVIIITLITMIAEIAYGYITNSMALLADGYHMGGHIVALGLTYAAYVIIRKLQDSEHFPNGTNKIGTLAAYTSAVLLGVMGIWIIFEAFMRLINPLEIEFNEAIIVAIIGFIVNGICIYVMHKNHTKKHSVEADEPDNRDYNFKAAYYHILADLITSILAISALLIGNFLEVTCFDSISGIFGGILISRWAFGLVKNTVKILIDMEP